MKRGSVFLLSTILSAGMIVPSFAQGVAGAPGNTNTLASIVAAPDPSSSDPATVAAVSVTPSPAEATPAPALPKPVGQLFSGGTPSSVSDAAARFLNADENGVDVNDGSFNYSIGEGSIGSGPGALAMVRSYGNLGLTDNWPSQLTRTLVSGQRRVKLQFGNTTAIFNRVNGVFVPENADGSTLVETGATYLYTSGSGTQINYATPPISANQSNGTEPAFATFCASNATDSCILQPTTITQPSGLTTALTWNGVIACGANPSRYCLATARLEAIQTNAGYKASIAYVSATPDAAAVGLGTTNWSRRSSVTFSNMSAPAQAWPQVTYAYPSTNVTQVTDMAGRQWQFTTQGNANGLQLVAIRRPGAASDTTVVTRNGITGEVTSVLKDGVTTIYSRVANGAEIITTVTDALSRRTEIRSDATLSRTTSVKDALDRVTRYGYDAAGRLNTTTSPEGNVTTLTYDARGNVKQTTLTPKPGPVLAAIVTRAEFPVTCGPPVTPATCNKPTATIDARGAQTDYAYDPVTGYPTTITAAAATSGIRPQTRFGYDVFGGVTMLTGTSACRSLATCANTADEVKSTIVGYTSNLLPTATSVSAGDGTLNVTAAFEYDAIGNQTSVDGPRTGVTDRTVFRYDAGRRAVGVIGPDPDGAVVTLKNRARRITYGPDGQVTLVEVGTATAQTDAGWAAFTPLRAVASSYDGNARKVSDRVSAGTTTYGVTHYSYDILGRLDCTAVRMNAAVWGSLPPSACTLQTAGSFGTDRIVKQSYDEVGRTSKVTSAYGTAAAADEARYSYSPNGQIATVTDANGNLTALEYDRFDRAYKTTYPSQTVPGSVNPGDYTTLTYDPNGNVLKRRLRDG